MIKTVLYIATSIDGFIAKPDGNLDWLTLFPAPQTGDYGYTDLLNSIEVIIMGRKTYDEVIGFGIEWPYNEFDTYVVTTNKNFEIKSPKTQVLSNNLKDFLTERKRTSSKDIWLVGGGQLVTTFLNEGLVDRMIITVIPKIIGEGIRLFPNKLVASNWKLIEAKPFDTGAVNLTYEKVD